MTDPDGRWFAENIVEELRSFVLDHCATEATALYEAADGSRWKLTVRNAEEVTTEVERLEL